MEKNRLIAAIAAQEAALVFPHFDEETAWRIGTALREAGIAAGWPVAIAVRLFHRPLFFTALPGSSPDNVEWARRKANVVRRFHKSSYRVGLECAEQGNSLFGMWGLSREEFTEFGGGFPIAVAGLGPVGACMVSGLPQEDDHMAIVRVLAAELGIDAAGLELPTSA